MRGMMGLATLLLALAVPPAALAVKPEASWTVSGQGLSFEAAGISVARNAAGAVYFETTEFSHPGEGIDTAVKYRTADGAVFATVYAYYPSVAHSGLQAIATDAAIRSNSETPVKALVTAVAAAGQSRDVALTADYDDYLGRFFSKAAFVKVGRWMVKVRVSGPQARAAEVEAVMAALLESLRFEGKARPQPAMPLSVSDCSGPERADARLLPDGEFGLTGALLATFDASGLTDTVKPRDGDAPLLPRIGREWCRSTLQIGDRSATLLEARDLDGPADGFGGKSALFLLYSDSGAMFEVVRLKEERQFLLLSHDIGQAEVLGTYDALPSAGQLRRLFSDPGEHGRIRARVKLKPNGNTDIQLPTPRKAT
jgi:hypothetical protein